MTTLLEVIVSIGIGIYGMRRFFVLRKYWQYRNDRVATESISVIARLLSLVAALPFLFKFMFVDKNLILMTKELLDVVITGSIFAIGTGLWLHSNRNINPLKTIVGAVRQERKEAMHVQENSEIHQILVRLVLVMQMLDTESSEEIKNFFEAFISSWRIPMKNEETAETKTLDNLTQDYIPLKPLIEQAVQLKDLLSLLMWSASENSAVPIIQNAIAHLQTYVAHEHQPYEVIVVPQTPDQHTQIQSWSATSQSRNGGIAYIMGSYYSKNIANMVSLRLIEKDLFSIVEISQFI